MKMIQYFFKETPYAGIIGGAGSFLVHFLTDKVAQDVESGIAILFGSGVAILYFIYWLRKVFKTS